ncbi:unnamed protein product [Amoebophrya sp. A120]|nr:unnamed protein product [Amoebophrya sp. A120]|eukprot:GSA120T00004313001.1
MPSRPPTSVVGRYQGGHSLRANTTTTLANAGVYRQLLHEHQGRIVTMALQQPNNYVVENKNDEHHHDRRLRQSCAATAYRSFYTKTRLLSSRYYDARVRHSYGQATLNARGRHHDQLGFSHDHSSAEQLHAQEDPTVHFVYPQDPLFASRREQRYFDDAAMQRVVLERNNVGMGYLVLNAPTDAFRTSQCSTKVGLDLPSVNLLITKLRDLEVNTTKRFVCLTHNMDDTIETCERRKHLLGAEFEHAGFVFEGLSEFDLLLLSAAEQRDKIKHRRHGYWSTVRKPRISSSTGTAFPETTITNGGPPVDDVEDSSSYDPSVAALNVEEDGSTGPRPAAVTSTSSLVIRTFLKHFQELTLTIADYRKPLLTHFPGYVLQEGVATLFFSEYSCASRSTKVRFPDLHAKPLLGGLSLLLASNSVAKFCALSNLELQGADSVYANLAKYWIAGQDAFDLLQLCAEKIAFATTEQDGRLLLKEHFLELPEASPWFKRRCALISRIMRNTAGNESDTEQPSARASLARKADVDDSNDDHHDEQQEVRREEDGQAHPENSLNTGGGDESSASRVSPTTPRTAKFDWRRQVNTWQREAIAAISGTMGESAADHHVTSAATKDALSFVTSCMRYFREDEKFRFDIIHPDRKNTATLDIKTEKGGEFGDSSDQETFRKAGSEESFSGGVCIQQEQAELARQKFTFALNWVLIQKAHQARLDTVKMAGDQQNVNRLFSSTSKNHSGSAASRSTQQHEHYLREEEHRHRSRIVDTLTLPRVLAMELKAAELHRQYMAEDTSVVVDFVQGHGVNLFDALSELLDEDGHQHASRRENARGKLSAGGCERAGETSRQEPRSLHSFGDTDTTTTTPVTSDYFDSCVLNRTEFALSAVPWVRKFHPDYDEETKADHDLVQGQRDKHRFSENFLQQELFEIKQSVCPDLVQRFH